MLKFIAMATFIFILLSLSITQSINVASHPVVRTDTQEEIKPVLIVGAGIAGAKVAQQLHERNIPFKIFEATDRVGGRMRTAPLGDDGVAVEIGANWMQGFRKGIPFFDFMTSVIKVRGYDTDFDDMVFVQNGSQVADEIADPIWSRTTEAFENLYKLKSELNARGNPFDISFQSGFLFQSGYKPTTPAEIIAMRQLVDFEYTLPSTDLSVYGLVPFYAPDAPKSKDIFVNDKRGYKASVDVTLKFAGVSNVKRNSSKLYLNSPVDTIKYSKDRAQVILRDGRMYSGSAVVSTVSLGVLKKSLMTQSSSKRRLKFDPPLNLTKRLAISKFTMGDYMKIFVRFKSPIFTKKDPLFLLPISCDRDGFLNLQNLNKPGYFVGSNAVLVTSTDSYSRELTCLDEESVLADVLTYVSAAAGRKVQRKEISAFVIPHFRSNEFFYGSFSTRGLGVTKKDLTELNRPSGALFFAGEAHRKDLVGYVNGAWDTGIITARQVVKFLRRRTAVSPKISK